MRKKGLLAGSLLLLLVVGYMGFRYYQQWFAPNVTREGKLFIPTGASYAQVLDSLRPYLKNSRHFDALARKKQYDVHIKPGRYSMVRGENNNNLINRLRLGAQDEIAIRIGNYSSIFELAGKISPFLEGDSAQIVSAVLRSDRSKGYDTAALLFYFLPDTYHFHWNTSGPQFVARMMQQYDRFWTAERLSLAQNAGMTPFEVTTLASIVQLESAKADEQPRVAGLYLNRLKIGMKLDADPTVIFAMKKATGFQQQIQRVYYKHLAIASPYNTYRNRGLPPGPICMPNASAIDAVLRPAQHQYLFFVADPERPGYHIYATTLKEQEENAKKYRNWLNEKNIK